MNLRKGSKVWFQDRVWVAAQVLDSYNDRFMLLTHSGNKVFASTEELFPSNADQEEHVSNEEAKKIENSKLQKMLEARNLELDEAKVATINECNKNVVLRNQLELLVKEKCALERDLVAVDELRKENALFKVSSDAFETKYATLELELMNAQKGRDETIEKLTEFELKCLQFEKNVKSGLEEKLLSLEDENHILRSCFAKSLSEDNYEFLSRCIKENLGFKNSKPLAACIIYKCLLHWHAFESERTSIFDSIIKRINEVLKVRAYDIILPYWLSNTSALLCLLQRNIRSNGFLTTTAQRYPGSFGRTNRTGHGPKSPLKFIGHDDGISHVEMRHPAMLFKQQLTALVEKIFGLLSDNFKKELSPLLGYCIQASNTGRGVHGGKFFGGHWRNIVILLDSLMSKLRGNHVPSFVIRKLVTQVFSFINITLFNREKTTISGNGSFLLFRRQCCTFTNGEYVKSGLAELEKWIVNAKEEYAGTSWHELNNTRQAVGFLVTHQKSEKSLEEIRQDICPTLTMRQIYRISTMYWDDKYGTQSVSDEVGSEMRDILSKDKQNLTSNSFFLDDDISIHFSAEDIDMAFPALDPDEIDLPEFISEYSCDQFINWSANS